jgi:hypothetical protein
MEAWLGEGEEMQVRGAGELALLRPWEARARWETARWETARWEEEAAEEAKQVEEEEE